MQNVARITLVDELNVFNVKTRNLKMYEMSRKVQTTSIQILTMSSDERIKNEIKVKRTTIVLSRKEVTLVEKVEKKEND